MRTPIIAPSILAADFCALGDDVRAVESADWIHVDIMDGHFVPNLSFGPDITAAVNGVTVKHLDVHLMIEKPAEWVETYARSGADCIIFHVEAVEDSAAARELVEKIHSLGVKAGISVKPATPVEPWLELVEHCDLVLVMSVEPGFGGQKFMPSMLEKVEVVRKHIDSKGLDVLVEIDGGIGPDTIAAAAAAGCDAFVAGSAIYKQADREAAITQLRALAAEAMNH